MAGGAIRHQIVGGPANQKGPTPAPLETNASLPQVPWWQARAFSVFLGLGIAVIVAASVYLGVLIRDRQHEFGEISRYNTTWTTSQAALEVAKLEASLAEFAAAGPKADPTNAQVRFDIVANRLSILSSGDLGALIKGDPELSAILSKLGQTMATAEKFIDHLDEPGVAAKLAVMFSTLASPMSQLAGAVHDAGGDMAANDVAQLRNLQYLFSSLQVALLAACLLLIIVLALNNRMLSRAHQDMGTLVADLRRTGIELGIANHETRRAAEEIQQQNRALQARDRELALQNTRFDAALNNMSQALCMVGADGTLIVCNQQFRSLFGIPSPESGVPIADLFQEIGRVGRCDADLIRRLYEGQSGLVRERRPGGFFVEGPLGGGKSEGVISALAVSHQPMPDGGWVATYSDISERRLAEIQLVHAQKMEAIGNLTGGMAHDFNNLLAVISLNLEYLLGKSAEEAKVREHASRALQASLRGANLISQLLAFARRQTLAPQHINVNTWIRSIADLLDHMLGERVRISLELGSKIWPVNTDATRLETAIANLATNARDAMPHGGKLTISTRNISVAQSDARGRPDVMAGDYVMIEVSDTGSGMSPEVMEHMFEPFFTTKDEGHGTGLGLSMVFGFIRQSGGFITVDSVLGEGTTFRLHLPRGEGDVAIEPSLVTPAAIIGGKETILVVEDNEAVRSITTDLLIQLGYEVIEARNPLEALDVLTSDRWIDLMFSDVVMPGGLDGFGLSQEAKRLRPQMKLLLTSGFAEFSDRPGNPMGHVRVLGKPFRQSELANALRDVLDTEVSA